ncbi:response regulator [Candidatus Woesearchaeota archaeon]|nr:MAG: response regulator [Candidatus Woesearchaeota archaeon]
MTKILVADDDPDMRLAIASVLRYRSYQVIEACDGREALRKLKEEKPDLLLLDLLMPEMDGFDVIKELRINQEKEYPDIPVLVISSVREEASQRRYELELGRKLDIDDYIEKPIEPFILLGRVEKLLSKGGKDAKAD